MPIRDRVAVSIGNFVDKFGGDRSRPLLCLAGSGGGHVRQLLDLEPLWRDYDHFFVTEPTALGRSIANNVETEFVPHFALGQARLGKRWLMAWNALKGIAKSASIVLRRRPDVVISTGAGSQVFIAAFARLLGARVIIIDSFARFDGPSAFARLAGPLAHRRYAQSVAAGEKWPGAIVFDPLRLLPAEDLPKQDMILATVGATLPFERLTSLTLEARHNGWLTGDLVLQAGTEAACIKPMPGVRVIESLSFDEIQQLLEMARIVICHGGTGSIITALKAHCRVIVVPREFERGEHYDNHQAEIAEAFEARGLVKIARDGKSLENALEWARTAPATPVVTNYNALADDLRRFIERQL